MSKVIVSTVLQIFFFRLNELFVQRQCCVTACVSKNVTISLEKCLRTSHELHVLSRDRSRANPPLQPPVFFFFFFLGVSNWKGGRA